MIGKRRSPACVGIVVLCVAVLAACGNGPSLHFVAVTPISGTVYFSSAVAAGVKGARAAAHTTRKSAAVLSPQDITTASCLSLQFTATAYFSDSSSKDVSSSATWSSSNQSVATVDPSGNATGIGLGTTTIGATFNTVPAAPAMLEVDALNSITMSPSTMSIASGASQQFQATGNFTLASGSQVQQPIVPTQLTWMSSNTNLVTVDQNGNATSTGNGAGQVMITATSCDGLTVGKATLNVGAPPVTLLITPSMPTIAAGTTLQFTAAHSDGSPVTNAITWQSTSASVSTIDPNSGLALAVASGSSTIMATEATTMFTGNTTLNVSAAAARFAYLGNLDDQTISSYTISSGALATNSSQSPYPFSGGSPGPLKVLIHPSGDFLYYIDNGCSLHVVFIDSTTGVLTLDPLNRVTSTAPLVGPCVGVMDALGRFIYVLGSGSSGISGFTITQPTAQSKADKSEANVTPITGVAPYTDATLNFPDWIMIDHTSNFLYVVNNANNPNTSAQGQGTISQYSITQSGAMAGALTPLSPATVNAGNGSSNGPFFGTIDVNNNLFVANLGNTTLDPQTVSAYSIGAGGLLTSLGPDTPIMGAKATTNVITSPVANNLYVLDSGPGGPGQAGQVFAYSYAISGTPATITLTQIGTTTQPTGDNPMGMAMDPTGTLLLIDDFGVNSTPPTPGAVFYYGVAANGGLPNAAATVPAGVGAEFVAIYTALAGQ